MSGGGRMKHMKRTLCLQLSIVVLSDALGLQARGIHWSIRK